MPSTQELVIEWISQILSIAYFLTPIISITNVYNNKLSIEKIPIFLLISIILNCLLWLACGVTREDEKGGLWASMVITNGIGLLVNFIILILYFYKYFQKRTLVFLAFCTFILVILIELFLILYFLVGKYDTIGICGMIVNVLMYASPSLNIIKLIKTGEYDFLPILTNSIGFVCCLLWIVYGVVTEKKDKKVPIIVSNMLSLIVVFIQIGYWSYYFYKKQTKQFEGVDIIDKENIKGGLVSTFTNDNTEDNNNENASTS